MKPNILFALILNHTTAVICNPFAWWGKNLVVGYKHNPKYLKVSRSSFFFFFFFQFITKIGFSYIRINGTSAINICQSDMDRHEP